MSLIISSNRGFGSFRPKDYVSFPHYDTTKLLQPFANYGYISNYCLKFPASPSYLSGLGDGQILEGVGKSFTVEMWIKMIGFGSGGNPTILSNRGNSTGGYLVWVQNGASSDPGKLSFFSSGSGTVMAPVPLVLDTWTHIAVTYQYSAGANIVKFYINGYLNATHTGLGDIAAPSPAASMNLGYEVGAPSNYSVNAYIDEFRYWSVVRTSEQIQNNYRKTLSGREENLVSYFDFEEGTGNPKNKVTNAPATPTSVVWSSDTPLLDQSTAIAHIVPNSHPDTIVFYDAIIAHSDTIAFIYLPAADAVIRQIVASGVSFRAFEYETMKYLRNVLHNKGTISASTLIAVDRFTKSLKNTGVYSKMIDMGLYCGNNIAAALTKLVYPSDGSPYLINNNFVDGDYSERIGFIGNGSNKYFNTQTKVSKFTQGSTSMSTYVRNNNTAATTPYMGAANDGVGTRFSMHQVLETVNIIYSDEYDLSGGRISVSAGSAGTGWGHILASRLPTPSHTIFRNGSLLTTNGGTGGTLSNLNSLDIYIMGANLNGTPSLGSPWTESFYHYGAGLSTLDAANLYAAVQELQIALGRAV